MITETGILHCPLRRQRTSLGLWMGLPSLMAQCSPLLYSHTPRSPLPDPLMMNSLFERAFDCSQLRNFTNRLEDSKISLRTLERSEGAITRRKNKISLEPESWMNHPVECPRATVSRYQRLRLFLRPRSPPRTRLPRWWSPRDWSTQGSTTIPHWSDRTFHGVEAECWLTPFNRNCAGSRMYSLWRHWSPRDVGGARADEWQKRLQGLPEENLFFFHPRCSLFYFSSPGRRCLSSILSV